MNQYRCETCKRRIGLIDSSNDCPGGIPSHLDVPWVWLIEQIGCTSHSDFQSERDKVLVWMVQLESYISNPDSLENYQTAWNALKSKIAEPRHNVDERDDKGKM
jgi:hypothetical protein